MTRLLVVDDDKQLRESLVRDLEAQGYEVSSASTVDDALALLGRVSRAIDVLVTDLRMPSRDGLDLLEAVRDLSPHTRSVLISAFASARDYDAAVERGAVAVVSKPFSRAELHAAISLAVECSGGMHGSLHGVSFLDVLQLYHLGRRSVEVQLGGAHGGSIVLENGEIVHATYASLTGNQALQHLLRADGGAIRTKPYRKDGPRTMDQPFAMLVLDALRTADEANRDDGDLNLDAFLEPAKEQEVAAPPAEPPPISAALAARWRAACGDWGKLADDAAVFTIGIGARRALEPEAEPVVEEALAMHAEALEVAGNARTGTLELVAGRVGIVMLWDLGAGALLVLVQDVGAKNAPAYFRARAAFLARKAIAIFAGEPRAVTSPEAVRSA